MIKKTITYVDYNDVERTENFYFNLSKAEIAEMELSQSGGLSTMLQKIVETKDAPSLMAIFKDIILKSYGEKALDGKRFIKNQELTDAFTQTEAYSNLFMELVTDDVAAAEFINGLLPAELRAEVEKEAKLAVVE